MESNQLPNAIKSQKEIILDTRSEVVFEESVTTMQEETAGTAAFAFVNATGPLVKNPGVQRSIRKHVMRDIGKSRRKGAKSKSPDPKPSYSKSESQISIVVEASPEFWNSVQLVCRARADRCSHPMCTAPACASTMPHLDNIDEPDDQVRPMYCYSHLEMANSQNESMPSISRFSGGRMDPFYAFPIDATPEVQKLVDHVFDDRKRNVKFYRDRIFPMGLIGPASFHQALANLATYLRHARRIEGTADYEAREEIAHQMQAMKLVNRNIAKQEAASEDTIGAVASMACHAHVVEDLKAFNMHRSGLHEMIRLRGGVDTLQSEVLRTTLYWLDVNGGCVDDAIPSYSFPQNIPFRPNLPRQILLPKTTQLTTRIWRALFPAETEIMDIFEDVSRVSLHVEAEERRTTGHIYTDVVFAGTLILSLIYRLLQIQPRFASELETPHGAIKEATRLGLLLFLAEVRRRIGVHPVNTEVHVEKLRAVLRREDTDWSAFNDLKIWIVAMGVLEARQEPCVRSMVDDWTQITATETVMVPANMERVMNNIMWMDSVHGKRYREMRDRFWGRGAILAPRPKVLVQLFEGGQFQDDDSSSEPN